MNNWKNKLDISDIWQNGDVPESEVHLVGGKIAKQLKLLYKDYEDYDKWGFDLEEIILNFEGIITLEDYNQDPADYSYIRPYDDFNNCMEALYDWADQDKHLWIQLN